MWAFLCFMTWQSDGRTTRPVTLLQTDPLDKSGFCELEILKAVTGDLNQTANCGPRYLKGGRLELNRYPPL